MISASVLSRWRHRPSPGGRAASSTIFDRPRSNRRDRAREKITTTPSEGAAPHGFRISEGLGTFERRYQTSTQSPISARRTPRSSIEKPRTDTRRFTQIRK